MGKLVAGVVMFFAFLFFLAVLTGDGERPGNSAATTSRTKSEVEGESAHVPSEPEEESEEPEGESDTDLKDIPEPQLEPESANAPSKSEPDTKRLIPYRIIKTDAYLDYKKSYDLQVDLVDGRLPTEEELAAVSRRLKSNAHERTFVLFYLPGMVLDSGAWASANHTPNFDGVRIMNFALPEKYKRIAESRSEPQSESKPIPKTKTFEYRVWTSVDGKYEVTAKFVKFISGTVTIKRKDDGREVSMPIEKLSDLDKDYIKGQR